MVIHQWSKHSNILIIVGVSERINPHEAKENIHLRPTSISRTLFRFFSFSGTSVSLSKSRDTGAAQKKELASPIQRATMLAITIGAAAPIDSVQYHHAYIGPVLVIPPRLFRGRDHLFTILPQHVHHLFTILPQHVHHVMLRAEQCPSQQLFTFRSFELVMSVSFTIF